mmetsp:Transcript_36534/g.105244  ORF Transcript_36534/g.105244 Transcript_36534/m.105244 type:complete len:114 (-) Transcript_36534:75-416(-)
MSSTVKDIDMMGIHIPEFDRVTVFDKTGTVKVDVNGVEEEVIVDPERGAMVLKMDGRLEPGLMVFHITGGRQTGGQDYKKSWKEMTYTEQKTMLHVVAKTNLRLKERMGWTSH